MAKAAIPRDPKIYKKKKYKIVQRRLRGGFTGEKKAKVWRNLYKNKTKRNPSEEATKNRSTYRNQKTRKRTTKGAKRGDFRGEGAWGKKCVSFVVVVVVAFNARATVNLK